MNRHSRALQSAVAICVLGLLAFALNSQLWAQEAPPPASTNPIPACEASAPSGYKGGQCVITIDRDNPVTPPTLMLPGHTTVLIQLTNARWNETVQFTTNTAQTPPVDIAVNVLKNVTSPLSQLVFSVKDSSKNLFEAETHIKVFRESHPAPTAAEAIDAEESDITQKLKTDLNRVGDAVAALSCLEAYKKLGDEPFACTNDSLTAAEFSKNRQDVIDRINKISVLSLPVGEDAALDKDISAQADACYKHAAGSAARAACIPDLDQWFSVQNVLKTTITNIQTTQTALFQSAQVLITWKGSQSTASYSITQPRNRNSTVTITAQEIVSKTATSVATVTINWQSVPFVLSTGILFSTLPSRSYSATPIVVNGQPSLDTGGKNLTQLTLDSTKPSIVTPIVFGNYRIPWLSRYRWEARCPNSCGFLIGGGVGANLSTKSADFAFGPSFQIGSFLLTPAAHWGRETFLDNGLVVNQPLGSSPISPIPTKTQSETKFGFAVTYVLPLT